MKRRAAFIVMMSCSIWNVGAQIPHGTLVVVYFTNDKIVMASDSRAVLGDTPPDDTVCKIAVVHGKAIVGLSGASGYNGDGGTVPPWRNMDEAHRIAEAVSRNSPIFGYAGDIAEMWAISIQSKFENLARMHPDKVIEAEQKGHGVLATGFFGGTDLAGKLSLYRSQITGTTISDLGHQTNVVNSCDMQSFCATGYADIFEEFLAGKTPRAAKESKNWKPPKGSKSSDYDLFKAMRLVELTEKYQIGKYVGGPIDSVEMDRNGHVRWFARKTNCPEN